MRVINNSWKPKSRQVLSSTNKPEPESRRFTNGYCGQIIVFPWPIIYNKLLCSVCIRREWHIGPITEQRRIEPGGLQWLLEAPAHGISPLMANTSQNLSQSVDAVCAGFLFVNVEENALCWREKAVWCLTCYRHCENITIDIRYWFQIFLW